MKGQSNRQLFCPQPPKFSSSSPTHYKFLIKPKNITHRDSHNKLSKKTVVIKIGDKTVKCEHLGR